MTCSPDKPACVAVAQAMPGMLSLWQQCAVFSCALLQSVLRTVFRSRYIHYSHLMNKEISHRDLDLKSHTSPASSFTNCAVVEENVITQSRDQVPVLHKASRTQMTYAKLECRRHGYGEPPDGWLLHKANWTTFNHRSPKARAGRQREALKVTASPPAQNNSREKCQTKQFLC